MNKILSLITMMIFVMILVSCTSSSLEDFTVYFYHPGDAPVVLKVDQDNEITMSSHDREGWYYATLKVESIDNLDLSLEFAVGLEKVQFELITKTAIYFSLNGQFTSFEEAEASGLDDAKTRVYFLNTNGWMQVYAYVFYGEPTSEAMGSWPGTPAVIDVDDLGSGWYYIDVELDVNSDQFTIIFNDGTGGEGRQTEDIFIDSRFALYVTMNAQGSPYNNKEDAEASVGNPNEPEGSTDVYFFNSDNWETVYVWAWRETTNAYPTWPGMLATPVSGKPGWYVATVPFDVLRGEFGLLFNNGLSESNEKKTPDVTVTTTLKYVSLAGIYGSYSAAEASLETLVPQDVMVYYFNAKSNWAKVHVYTFSPELFGTWPGTEMTYESNGWYQILLEDVILPVNIIFNNGSGGESNQTANLQVTNDTNVYFFDGTWYASKEDAHTANGGAVIDPLPEEPVLPTTVYFYNSNNWTDVYAWAWNAGGNAFETWPGIKAQVIEGKDSWFMVEVPFEGEFGILFSNGLSNADERKTDDLIVTEENVYASLAGIYSSFDAAEEAVFELEPEVEVDVEIWFLNSKQKWETLKVFTFSPEIVGEYPGTLMIEEADEWYSFKFENVILPLNIIFNNGLTGFDNQTIDLVLDNTEYIYFYNGIWYNSKTSAEAEALLDVEPEEPEEPQDPEDPLLEKIYFYNALDWENIYIWAWQEGGNSLVGSWPGKQLTVLLDQEGWFFVDLDFDLKLVSGLLFSNGSNQQTRDLIIESGLFFTYFGSFETRLEAEVAIDEFLNETTFYIYNSLENTPTLYIHYWFLKIDGNGPDSSWPGVEATALEGHDGWFKVIIPVHIMYTRYGINYIIHDNNSHHTGDLNQSNPDHVYFTVYGVGYSSIEEVLTALA